MSGSGGIYGLLAEFSDPNELVAAAAQTHAAGYLRFDCYTPFPIEELTEAMGHHHTRLPLLVLLGGIFGCLGGLALCYWTSAVDLPLIVGGRPFASWPAYIPVTFECTVLGAALTAVFSLLGLNGLPRLHHPVFNVPRFALASRDRFFLCIEASDPRFDLGETRAFLTRLQPREVSQVEQ